MAKDLQAALAEVVDPELARLDAGDLLDQLVDRLRRTLSTDSAAILLREDDELVVVAASGVDAERARGARIPFPRDLAGRLPVVVPDVRAAGEILTPSERMRSLAAAPLLSGDEVLGVLQVGSATERAFEPDLVLLAVAALRAAAALERSRSSKGLQERLIEASKLESIGRLAAGVAHDFTNVLTTVTGYAHLALSRLDPHDPAHADIREIVRSTERAGQLVHQLQAFSRGVRMEVQVVDLNQSVRDIARLLEVVMGEHIAVELRLGVGLPGVEANLGALEQAVMSLAVNARDAMPAGGRLVIETGASDHGQVWLSVADTGAGMDDDTRRRAFEPFFTTKTRQQGTGLGLTMVYGMVERLRGQVELRSQPSDGTTVTIRLPAAAEPAVGAPSGPPGAATILLVEDEDALRRVVIRILRDDGFAVTAVSSGEEALALVERGGTEFDLLVSDVVMPGMTGPELVARLRARRPRIKTLLMSGYPGVPLGEVDAFLPKPFSPFELARRIRQILRP